MINFSKGSEMWCNEKDEVIEELARDIDGVIKFKSYEEKCKVKDVIYSHLHDSVIYKSKNHDNKTKLIYRLLFLIFIPCQLLIVPYCAIKWLFGKGWYLENNSKLSNLIRKINMNS